VPQSGLAEDCIGPKAEAAVAALKDGDVLLLETPASTRRGRHDPAMASVAALAIFRHDAFSAAHRAHASTEACAACPMRRALDAGGTHPLQKALAIPSARCWRGGRRKCPPRSSLLENLVTRVETLVTAAHGNTFLRRRHRPRQVAL